MFNIQEQLFDVILPGALPLLLTLGTYKLVKKGWSSVNIIILVAAVGLGRRTPGNFCIIVRRKYDTGIQIFFAGRIPAPQ
ncbi:MAG: PTS system mannose/fructose/sorbose family transporter subunit IID [Enterocloster clostridioformis]